MSAEPRSWDRYWRILERLDPGARGPGDLMVDRLLELAPPRRWLDAGCGRRSLPVWRQQEMTRIEVAGTERHGCDLDREALREREDAVPVCLARLDRLPYRDGSFALVSSNMVFEHLDAPEDVVAELARVTEAEGRILIHTVNARHYAAWAAHLTPFWFHQFIVPRLEGRPADEVYPTRYRANTPRRLRALFEAHGCRQVGGGYVRELPFNIRYPVLFWVALLLGVLERRLALLPGLRSILSANLLMEFQRDRDCSPAGGPGMMPAISARV